jgi:hypothetical protein
MKENTLVDLEQTTDPYVAIVHTNRQLSESVEAYETREEALAGSPLAALLATIDGIAGLELAGQGMTIRRDADVSWEDIALQVIEALKDFYLL